MSQTILLSHTGELRDQTSFSVSGEVTLTQ